MFKRYRSARVIVLICCIASFSQIPTRGLVAYYPLDSYEDDGGHVYPDRAGNLRPVVDLERIREGIDDYRYTLALTRAIAGRQSATAAEASAWLRSVTDKIKFEDTRRDRRPQMTEKELDNFRAKVQDYLVRLSQ